MKLSQKQQEAFDECLHFFLESKEQLFVLSGVAGSGKSVIVSELMQFFQKELEEFIYTKRIAVMTLTGKAAKVLRDKGVTEAQTIHSYLYVPMYDASGELIGFNPVDPLSLKNDFIIIDEGSMVTNEIYDDLRALGKKILVVGDENQLPPVVINGKSSFNLMKNPNIRLEEIHRQAEDSPIIVLSQYILETGRLPKTTFHDDIRYIRLKEAEAYLRKNANQFDITLCATHVMRTKLNKAARKHYGRYGRYPEPGDKIICLKNNKYRFPPTFNGEIFEVTAVSLDKLIHTGKEDVREYVANLTDVNEHTNYNLKIEDDLWFNGTPSLKQIQFPTQEETPFSMATFGKSMFSTLPDIFDFGEAITVHKSQGSEFNRVLYVDQDVSNWCDQSKFRYTAVTRAKELLTIAK